MPQSSGQMKWYFTNLDFPEIAKVVPLPFQKATKSVGAQKLAVGKVVSPVTFNDQPAYWEG